MPSGTSFRVSVDLALEIAVGGAARHGRERSHAAIGFVGAALVEIDLAGAFVRAREQRADHDASRAAGERLRDVARIFDAAIGDDGHAMARGGLRGLHDRRQLRHADARDDARGADRAGADADLDCVRARVDQRQRRLRRWPRCRRSPELLLEARLMRRTASRTRWEWPCAVSTTMRSAPASMMCSLRS